MKRNEAEPKREVFGSRFGFIVACIGSAVGMGNIWMFPTRVSKYGGGEGTLSGRLDNNLTVEFKADSALMGSYAMVRLTGARATVLLGELSE